MGTMQAIMDLTREQLWAHLGDLDSYVVDTVSAGVSMDAGVPLAAVSNLVSTLVSDDAIVGSYAYINVDVGGADAAPQGEFRQVTQYDRANGRITYANAYSAEPGAGDFFQLYYGFTPQRIIDFINRALRAGTRGVVTSLAHDWSTAQTALPDNYVVEGALYFARLAQARKLKQGSTERRDTNLLARQNLENFRRLVRPIYGEIYLGRRDPQQTSVPTESEQLRRF